MLLISKVQAENVSCAFGGKMHGLDAMTLHIRYAQARDYQKINALCLEVHEEHVQALPNVFHSVHYVYHPVYYAELLNAESSSIFVAEDEETGELVGYGIVEYKEIMDHPLLVSRRYAYLANLGVSPGWRGQGIGRRLFRACVEWSRDKRCESMELNVWEYNQSAIGFYQSLGMRTMSRKMEIDLPGEERSTLDI